MTLFKISFWYLIGLLLGSIPAVIITFIIYFRFKRKIEKDFKEYVRFRSMETMEKIEEIRHRHDPIV